MSKTKCLLAVMGLAILTACSNSDDQPVSNDSHHDLQKKTISGMVSYRERMALPPNTTVRVVLEKINQASGTSQQIAEQVVEPSHSVPIPFRLEYKPVPLESDHKFSLQAQILKADGQLLWTTTVRKEVNPNDPPPSITLTLHRAAFQQGQLPNSKKKPARPWVFECHDLAFSAVSSPDKITLYLPQGRNETLARVRAASGAKYEGKEILFWNKGNSAILEIGGKRYQNCHRNQEREARIPSTFWPVDFHATGNEPGWIIEIVKGHRVNLLMDYGKSRVSLPWINPKTSGESTIYETKTGSHRLRIVIAPEACMDSMSGEQFEAQVILKLADKTYRGCGRFLE
ncbi:YbaY family lipoprotein [Nitrosococcus watsonii]|uniref:C-type lysozyme inhibitor domain-containing protein n=1 Tax=Nitrosococcus watsoni (strain C-113) TaxID=105559 RepID=D8KA21_NITWC|nr:YbaY family lipoprotein [Nitrosococcus watsonii]ADJ29379.1 Protein of unknown function DUF2091, periplasmic [Nitrosococcus watsonii C-113]